jgi:hypothetical protein
MERRPYSRVAQTPWNRRGKEPGRNDAGESMTQMHTTPESVPTSLDAVRREFRRSRRSTAPKGWRAGRLREQLPRVALYEALEILLGWRGESRFDAGAVAWHARLAGHAPGLTLEDAEQALTALEELGGSRPDVGALALHALCKRYQLEDAAAVLGHWLEERQAFGGF